MSLKNKLSPQELAEYVNPPRSLSLSAVGRMYDVSRQRVHQVYSEYREKYPGLFIEIPDPPSDKIIEMLGKNIAMGEIADVFNISLGRLKRCMDKYGIEKRFIKDRLTKRVLLELYVKKECSDEEIADRYNCSPNTVMKLRYDNNIYENMRAPLDKKLTREIFIELYDKYDLLLRQIAALFNTNVQAIIELKKGYDVCKKRAAGVSKQMLQQIRNDLIKRGVIKCE